MNGTGFIVVALFIGLALVNIALLAKSARYTTALHQIATTNGACCGSDKDCPTCIAMKALYGRKTPHRGPCHD